MESNFNPGCAFIYTLLNQVYVCELVKEENRHLSNATQNIGACFLKLSVYQPRNQILKFENSEAI